MESMTQKRQAQQHDSDWESALDPVTQDFFSDLSLQVAYFSPAAGTLTGLVMLEAGDLSQSLARRIRNNLYLTPIPSQTLALESMHILPLRPVYRVAHWLLTELFFKINFARQITGYRRLYPLFPWLTKISTNLSLPIGVQHQMQLALGLFIPEVELPLLVVRVGNESLTELNIFIEQMRLLKRDCEARQVAGPLAAVYLTLGSLKTDLVTACEALYDSDSRHQGYISVSGREGFHLFLAEYQAPELKLLAPLVLS